MTRGPARASLTRTDPHLTATWTWPRWPRPMPSPFAGVGSSRPGVDRGAPLAL